MRRMSKDKMAENVYQSSAVGSWSRDRSLLSRQGKMAQYTENIGEAVRGEKW